MKGRKTPHIHQWATRVVKEGLVSATVLQCLCGERRVVSFPPNGHCAGARQPEARQRRLALVDRLRRTP